MRARSVSVIVTSIALALATGRLASGDPSAIRDPKAADVRIESAKQHYTRGELDASLADFAEAHRLDPRPELLYAMAQLEVELGYCAGALDHYNQFLATNPLPKAREAAEKGKAPCQDKLRGPVVPATPPAEPEQPKIVAVTSPTPVDAQPFYKDPLFGALAIGALAAAGTGVGLYVVAHNDIDDSETAPNLQGHADLVRRAHGLRTAAVIAGSVGGALAVAAIVRWTTLRVSESADVAVSTSPDGTGWGIAAFARF